MTIIWAILTLVYALLSVMQWRFIGLSLKQVVFTGKVKAINGIPLGTKELSEDINTFIDNFNKYNKQNSIVQFIGCLAATLTALISFVISYFGAG